MRSEPLRVALVVGSMVRGGAEKQLLYWARALRDSSAEVQLYALTRGEPFEADVRNAGFSPVWIGERHGRAKRISALRAEARRFRPHIVQSTHFFANLYAATTALGTHALSVGALRSDGTLERTENGRWTPWLARAPYGLIANSSAGCRAALALGADPARVQMVANAIDVAQFDELASFADLRAAPANGDVTMLAVGRLIAAKRFDIWLRVLSRARQAVPGLRGVLIGDGPLRGDLSRQAAELGLLPDGLEMLGERSDVPAQLGKADIYVSSSDHEGFPNVVLEAMTAGLPVVATAAGGTVDFVRDGHTGFHVAVGDERALVDRVLQLAKSPELRRRLGSAGRQQVIDQSGLETLGQRLREAYRCIARGKRIPV